MVKVTYVQPDGSQRTLDIPPGLSVMEGAVKKNLPGIDADCGGACSCATCHVKVDPSWTAVVGPAGVLEEEMLDMAPDVEPHSRLSCQIKLTTAMDGLVVAIPSSHR